MAGGQSSIYRMDKSTPGGTGVHELDPRVLYKTKNSMDYGGSVGQGISHSNNRPLELGTIYNSSSPFNN